MNSAAFFLCSLGGMMLLRKYVKTNFQDVSDVYGAISWDCFLKSSKAEHTPNRTKGLSFTSVSPEKTSWGFISTKIIHNIHSLGNYGVVN